MSSKESMCTTLRNAAIILFDAGWSFEQVKEWVSTIEQPAAGYVRLTDIPNTGGVAQ